MTKLEFVERKNEFINYLKNKQRSLNTQKSYALDLEQMLNFWIIYEKNNNVTLTLDKVVLFYLESFNNKTDSTHSSIARKVSCINSFKKYLSLSGIKLNVKPKRPIIKLKEPKTLNTEDLAIILDLIDITKFPTKYPYRDKAIIELLYATGILCSEITHIELKHIDFKFQTILIPNRNKRERLVIFGNKAAQYISLYINTERIKINNNTEKLFLNSKNKPLGVRTVQRICQMFKFHLGPNKTLSPNILRNSFAIHMLERGLNVDQMQKLLGHKVRISTERYMIKKNKSET